MPEVDLPERAPAFERVLEVAMGMALLGLHKCKVAQVVKWDASTQKADCQPLVKNVRLEEDDTRVAESWPVVPCCPVMFPGGGGYRFTHPISDGTLVLDGATVPATLGVLFFSDNSIDRLLASTSGEVDPEIDHSHAPSDGIFVPGFHTFAAPLASCPTDHATIGADGGVQLHLRKNLITAGDESGADFVALATKVFDQFNAIVTTIVNWVPVPNDGGAALKTALLALFAGPPSWPESVATTQFKAK